MRTIKRLIQWDESYFIEEATWCKLRTTSWTKHIKYQVKICRFYLLLFNIRSDSYENAYLERLTLKINFSEILQQFRSFNRLHLFAQTGNVFALDGVHIVQRVCKRQHRVADKLQLVFHRWPFSFQEVTGVAVDCKIWVVRRSHAIRIFALKVFFPKFCRIKK